MSEPKTLTLPQMLRKYLRVQAVISSLYAQQDELYNAIAVQVEAGDTVKIGKRRKVLVTDVSEGKHHAYRPKRFDKFSFKVVERTPLKSSGTALTLKTGRSSARAGDGSCL